MEGKTKFLMLLIVYNMAVGLIQLKAQGGITVIEEPAVSRAMTHYKKVNKSITHISGWRITVITTADRRQMEEVKNIFQKNFSYRVRTEYKEPYYHLRAGAFISRNEAAGALESIKKKFPSAFLSVDKISYEEL